MGRPTDTLFDIAVWEPALEKYGAVVQLSVALYDAEARIVCGPVPASPILSAFQEHGYDPGVFAQCVRECLSQPGDHRGPVVVTPPSGLAVVGVSLQRDGQIVGAIVAGYGLSTFCESIAIERLARESGAPFQQLWAVARVQVPLSTQRLALRGELLQVLGDTLLRENDLRRHSETIAAKLTASAAANEEFLAVLSHELRNPLTPILAWTGILRMQSDPEVVRGVEVIERNVRLQTRLIDDLLELSRVTRGKLALNLEILNFITPLRNAVESVAADAQRKRIAVRIVDVREPLHINADSDRLQQILRNVLLNTVKFTPEGGAVTLTLTREGDHGVVRVRDTGEGIAPAFLPFVFEMFRQEEKGTRRRHGGLGIGLALVRQLTEAHGGTVSVASDGVGRGTLVTIRLPLVASTVPLPEPVQPLAGDLLALDGLRILIVEDSEDAREAMRVTLERLGASVLTANDGIEALEKVMGDDVDLILCDLRMPRMDGFEFIRELHSLADHPHPPVIAVSGFGSSADHLATQAAGFTGHVDKPFDAGRLLAAVGVALVATPRG